MSIDPFELAVSDALVMRPGAALDITEAGYDTGVTDYTIVMTIGNPTFTIRTWNGNAINPNWAANKAVFLLTAGALPTGFTHSHAGTTRTTYYVKTPSGSTIQLSATPGGAAITPTGTQSGAHVVAADAFTAFKLPENAISKYLPRMCALYYTHPDVHRYSIYSLLDDKNTGNRYGLCDATTKVPRRQYYSVRNLFFHARDAGAPYVPAAISYTVTPDAGANEFKHVCLGLRTGAYLFLMWNEVDSYNRNTQAEINPANINVTLRCTSPAFTSCQIFTPTVLNAESPDTKRDTPTSTPSIATLTSTGIVISVPDHVLIVKLIP